MTDSTETLRVFAAQRFTSMPIPPWLSEAIRLSCDEQLDWAKALSRMLDTEQQGLTVEPMGAAGIEINFWRSPLYGVYVEIETPLALIEQVLIPDDADWLPFMSAHLTPLLAAISQMQIASEIERLTNGVIAFARHGEGDHIDRSTGRSRTDMRRDKRSAMGSN